MGKKSVDSRRRRGLDSNERWLVMVDEGGLYAGRLRCQVFSGRGGWRSHGGRDQN